MTTPSQPNEARPAMKSTAEVSPELMSAPLSPTTRSLPSRSPSATTRASVAAMGLTPEEVKALIESFGSMPGELHFVASTAGLFRLFDGPSPPEALLMRPSARVEPALVIDVIRSRHPELPVMVLCETELEASYYNARVDLAPVIGLVGPLRSGGILLSNLFLGARATALEPVEAEGDVDEQGLARLLFKHQARRSTGELVLTRGMVQRTIFLLDGEPVWAESTLLDENFGRFLLRRGVINEVEYRWSQRLQNREGVRQGEALVKIGVFTEEVLHRLLHQQIRSKLVSAFDGGTSHYRFSPNRSWLWRENLHGFDLVEVVAEGLNRGISSEAIESRWERMRRMWIIIHTTGRPMWLGQERRGGGASRSRVEVRALEELFSPTLSIRRRLSTIDAMVLSHQAILTETPPEGLVIDRPIKSSSEVSLDEALERITPIAQPEDVGAILGVSAEASTVEIDGAYAGLKQRYAPERFDASPQTREVLRRVHARIELAYQMARQGVSLAELEKARAEQASANRQWRNDAVQAEEHFHEGQSFLQKEAFEEALAAFGKAQALNGGEPLFALYHGWTLTRMDAPGSPRWERGKRLIARTLEVCPVLPHAHVLRARLAIEENDSALATELLERAVRLEPSQLEARGMLEGLREGVQAPVAMHS